MRKRSIIILTIINLILLVISAACFVGTSRNNKIINSAQREFTYRDEHGEVVFRLKDGEEVTIRFGENSAKIMESYRFNDRKAAIEIVFFIKEYALQNGYSVVRDITELYGELRLHNVLYVLGYKKLHTKDCDLDYVADSRWYVNAASKIIGWSGI